MNKLELISIDYILYIEQVLENETGKRRKKEKTLKESQTSTKIFWRVIRDGASQLTHNFHEEELAPPPYKNNSF